MTGSVFPQCAIPLFSPTRASSGPSPLAGDHVETQCHPGTRPAGQEAARSFKPDRVVKVYDRGLEDSGKYQLRKEPAQVAVKTVVEGNIFGPHAGEGSRLSGTRKSGERDGKCRSNPPGVGDESLC
jgi:hypothetical protein